jgi:hypothetical protein
MGGGNSAPMTSRIESKSLVMDPVSRRFLFLLLVVVVLALPEAKKAGRRELLGVASHDGLAGAHEGPRRALGGDLGGLIEDHHVEALSRPGAPGKPQAGSSPSRA